MTDTRTIPVPVETVTPIKPSEAIRLGCLLRPVQTFGVTFQGHNGACAVGAMSVGYGDIGAFLVGRASLPDTCPVDASHSYTSPEWGRGVGPMTPAHLNDDHRWSRERIADWLEGLGL